MARTQLTKEGILNNELTGASFTPEMKIYNETMNYSSGDTIIWQNEEYTCNVNIIGTTEGDLTASPDLSVDWELKPNISYSVYPSTSQTLGTTRSTITFDTERFTSTYCSLSGNEITVNADGTFLVSVSLSSSNSTTTRHSTSGYLQINTGSGYSDVPNFELNVYNRQSTDGKTTANLLIPIKFTTGDKLRVQGISNTASDITSYINGCSLTIFGLDSVSGARGIQGIPGPSGDLKWLGTYSAGTYNKFDTVEYLGSSYTCLVNGTTSSPPGTAGVDWDLVAQKGSSGAGTTITVAHNAVNLPNTPHGTLNFTGDITSTDVGAGVADINVTFPKNTYMLSVWAEENAALSNGGYEWAFGNGANSANGQGLSIYVPSGYTCELVAMSLSLRQGTATVESLKNTTLNGASADVTVSSGTKNTNEFTPIGYLDNDIINFRTTTQSGTGGPNVVTAWFKYTEI